MKHEESYKNVNIRVPSDLVSEIKILAIQKDVYAKDLILNNGLPNTNSFLPPQKERIPELLSIHQAAKISGLGRNNLAFIIKQKYLPVVKIPGYNRIKIHYNDLIEFINNHKYLHR